MKVILLQELKGKGGEGDVIDVADGFANNYLLTEGLEMCIRDRPTMAVVFEASNSPLVGREGEIVGARQLKERLMREAESNISMAVHRYPQPCMFPQPCLPDVLSRLDRHHAD